MANHGDSAELAIVGSFNGNMTWMAYPEETMERASHVLEDKGELWIIDPVDQSGLDEELSDRGEVKGVVVLLDRHKRDAAEIAKRFDVPVYVPAVMSDIETEIDAKTVQFTGELAETGYLSRVILDTPFWTEVALYHDQKRMLVIPEAVGTASYFLADSERLGVHPMLRMTPPRDALRNIDPERILVGHGRPILDNGETALEEALAGSRRNAPGLAGKTVKNFIFGR